MIFQIYRFSQAPTVTFFSVVYTVFTMLSYGLNVNMILSAVISLVAFCIIFIPVLSILYPVIFLGYMIASTIILFDSGKIHFYLVIAVLILTIVRFSYMFLFSILNPDLSKEYDEILRR